MFIELHGCANVGPAKMTIPGAKFIPPHAVVGLAVVHILLRALRQLSGRKGIPIIVPTQRCRQIWSASQLFDRQGPCVSGGVGDCRLTALDADDDKFIPQEIGFGDGFLTAQNDIIAVQHGLICARASAERRHLECGHFAGQAELVGHCRERRVVHLLDRVPQTPVFGGQEPSAAQRLRRVRNPHQAFDARARRSQIRARQIDRCGRLVDDIDASKPVQRLQFTRSGAENLTCQDNRPPLHKHRVQLDRVGLIIVIDRDV